MQKFRFCCLPETYSVGPVVLQPRNNSARRLRPCCVCRKVSLIYYKCTSEHSFCPDCFIPPTLERKWCVICDDHKDFNVENLRIDAIVDMVFSCACGLEGPLMNIREHLLKTPSPDVCYRQEAAEVEQPQPPPTALQNVIAELEETRAFVAQQGELITTLVEGCCRMRAICDVLSGDSQIFCFNFNNLNRTPTEQHKVLDGAPLRIQVSIVGLPREPFLSVNVSGSRVGARDADWPLRKCITLSILDSQGRVHASSDLPTYENGSYTHPSFIDPTSESSSPGVGTLMSLAKVRGFYKRDEPDFLILSVKVDDLS